MKKPISIYHVHYSDASRSLRISSDTDIIPKRLAVSEGKRYAQTVNEYYPDAEPIHITRIVRVK